MTKTVSFSDFPLFKNAARRRQLLDLTLELTARCNNNCHHCYNNLPEKDPDAIKNEMSTSEIKSIIDQAYDLGTLRVLLTGGEALLREDFFDLYTYIKQKGILVSVFTNATIISEDHIRLFKKFPPKSLEITVYGTCEKEYAKITGTSNFPLFKTAVDRLLSESIPITLKAMVFRSNMPFIENICDFSKNISRTTFRFDPFLSLRTDRDHGKNQKIQKERLTADEIIGLEKQDPERLEALRARKPDNAQKNASDPPEKLFQCGAGKFSCFVSYDGFFRLCRPLVHSRCVYDLKKGTLKQAWESFTPDIQALTSANKTYQESCGKCDIRNICKWCPAFADLETGTLDAPVAYFCEIAKKRHEYCFDNTLE